MDYEAMSKFLRDHKGKIIGICLGLLFGILVLTVGFWRSFFLAVCVGIGYLAGSFHDKDDKFRSFLDKILPTGIR